ncbi:hypothetical protein R1flu_017962 [Riccia fluitans]|uniref:PPPDE domain-containing protein n=1 Tax=Riccia fluitans TaxID=41844 RepID=A0ABD1ZIE9_9MARC
MRMSVPTTGSDGSSATNLVPIYLNVYDLTPMNGYVYWVGLGIFHSGIEVHGLEYAFGAHDFPTSGVFEVEPRSCPGFTFRRSILLGTTDLSPQDFRRFIEAVADDYSGNTYHLIVKNCNHFTNDVCCRLTGKEIPGWVNRLAGIGLFCNCLLPESLQVPTASSDEGYEGPEHELKRSLTNLSEGTLDTVSSKDAESEGDQDDHQLLLRMPNIDSQALTQEQKRNREKGRTGGVWDTSFGRLPPQFREHGNEEDVCFDSSVIITSQRAFRGVTQKYAKTRIFCYIAEEIAFPAVIYQNVPFLTTSFHLPRPGFNFAS